MVHSVLWPFTASGSIPLQEQRQKTAVQDLPPAIFLQLNYQEGCSCRGQCWETLSLGTKYIKKLFFNDKINNSFKKNRNVFKLVRISSAAFQPLHPPDVSFFVFSFFFPPVEMLIDLIVIPGDEIDLLEYSFVDSTLSPSILRRRFSLSPSLSKRRDILDILLFVLD